MNTKVNLAGVELKNPVMVASGTFGSGAEYGEFVDSKIGDKANSVTPGDKTSERIISEYKKMMHKFSR